MSDLINSGEIIQINKPTEIHIHPRGKNQLVLNY